MKELCKRGHKLSSGTTFIDSRGAVSCKECRKIWDKNFRDKNWKDYRNHYLFGGNREEAIQRDGEKCMACGMTRAQHIEKYGRDITVDHIDGNGRYTPRPERNNDLSNLMTLCLYCHGKKDAARRGSKQLKGLVTEDTK